MSDPTTSPTPPATTAPAGKPPKAPKEERAAEAGAPKEDKHAERTPSNTTATPVDERSLRQRQAADLKDSLKHVVEALVSGVPGDPSSPMKRMGAALMAAHIAIDDKRAHKDLPKKASATDMNHADVNAYAKAFRSKFPGAWGAANRCDVANFVRFLRVGDLRGWKQNDETCELADEPNEKIIVEYQGAMSALSQA